MTRDQTKKLQELLADDSDVLNDWDIDFLGGINMRNEAHAGGYQLSDKQEACLERIWNKVIERERRWTTAYTGCDRDTCDL